MATELENIVRSDTGELTRTIQLIGDDGRAFHSGISTVLVPDTDNDRFAQNVEPVQSISGAQLPFEQVDPKISRMWDKGYLLGEIEYQSRRKSRQKPGVGQPVRIADVFCGAGGLSRGVHDAIKSAGLKPEMMLALDNDPVAVEVYKENFSPVPFSSTQDAWSALGFDVGSEAEVDLTEFDNKLKDWFDHHPKLSPDLDGARGKVDILLGGPPCEGHSNFNNWTRRADLRNLLYLVMPMMAFALDAQVVVVENVPAVLVDKFQALKRSREWFEELGYDVTEEDPNPKIKNKNIINAYHLGLPQTRRRHLLIATKRDEARGKGPVNLDLYKEGLKRERRSLEWVIGDLLDRAPTDLMNTPSNLTDENKARIRYLFDKNINKLPDSERPLSHKYGNTYPSIYGRMQWDQPSGTITTGFQSPGRGKFIHPLKRRTMTPHEAARVQGFPDNFQWARHDGEDLARGSIAKMIGDAVPPVMGFLGGLAALNHLGNYFVKREAK